ncbi:MAG: hypothetical protein ACRC7W_05290, partial [Fusobacteriaceae bacterium]
MSHSLKLGSKITIDGVKLKAYRGKGCCDCYFKTDGNKLISCLNYFQELGFCSKINRDDRKDII